MQKNVVCANQELQKIIDELSFTTIVVEQIQWRVDRDSQCHPYIVAKLTTALPVAVENRSLFFARPIQRRMLDVRPVLCN